MSLDVGNIDITGIMFGNLGVALIFMAIVLTVCFWVLYKYKIGPFKWTGAMKITVHNVEGETITKIIDSIREQVDVDGTVSYESKFFKEFIPESILSPGFKTTKSRGGYIKTGDFFRANGEWSRVDYQRDPLTNKIIITQQIDPSARMALVHQRKRNASWLANGNWLKEYGGIIIAGFALMATIVIVLLLLQFATNAMNAPVNQLAQATNLLAEIVNQTATCRGIVGPTPPPA